MPLATTAQLRDLRNSLRSALDDYAKDMGPTRWGWPGGSKRLAHAYMIPTPKGILLLGPDDSYQNRLWLAIGLTDDLPSGDAIISFEFNVPKNGSVSNLSLEYESLGPRVIQARHKGWVTVVQRVAAHEFFDFYDRSPGPWAVLPTERGDRLALFTFDLVHMGYPQFYALVSTLAEFADYITWYKDSIRQRRE